MLPDSTNPRVLADNIKNLIKQIKAIPIVKGNPAGSGFNTLLTKIQIGSSKYKLPANVEANPEGEATGSLTKLGVGSSIFNVGGSLPAYSTTEYDTGEKWIDGSTIYGKVIVLEDVAFDSNGFYEINLTTLNVKNCFPDMAHSFYTFSTYVRMFDGIAQEADSDFTTSNVLILKGTANRAITLGYVTIQYTKTASE